MDFFVITSDSSVLPSLVQFLMHQTLIVNFIIQKLKSKHLVFLSFLWWQVFLREREIIFYTYSGLTVYCTLYLLSITLLNQSTVLAQYLGQTLFHSFQVSKKENHSFSTNEKKNCTNQILEIIGDGFVSFFKKNEKKKYQSTLGPKNVLGGWFLETRVIIKIESHPFYPINFHCFHGDEAIFFIKILGICPWINRIINWCGGHSCGSIYMVVRLSDVRSI